jgi:endonuclease/exonuclease/phosphatase (EEP) superfamily protein YafD
MKDRSCPFFLILGYTFLLVIWYSAWMTIGDSLWWLALLNRVVMWAFLPLPVLLLLTTRRPRCRKLLCLLPGLFITALVLGPLLVPHLPPTPTHPRLRVLSFNVLFNNPTPAALVATIRSADADVVALQEVQPPLMEQLIDTFRTSYPYTVIAPHHPYGTPALLSRIPFQATQILDLQADRSAVLVQIEYTGQPITIVSAHLLAYGLEWVSWSDLPAVVNQRVREQERQAARILAATAGDAPSSVIVACDCNSPETSGTTRLFYRAFQSSARAAGWSWRAFSQPGAHPDLAPNHIDYVFYRGALQAVAHYLLEEQGGSDHHPVVAEFG